MSSRGGSHRGGAVARNGNHHGSSSGVYSRSSNSRSSNSTYSTSQSSSSPSQHLQQEMQRMGLGKDGEPKTVRAEDRAVRKWVGNQGKSIRLVTNYFQIRSKQGKELPLLHCYHVEVYKLCGPNRAEAKEVKGSASRFLRRALFWDFVEDNLWRFGGTDFDLCYRIIYDDGKLLFTSVELDLSSEDGKHSGSHPTVLDCKVMRNNYTYLITVKPFGEEPRRKMDCTILNILITQLARFPHGPLVSAVQCEVDRVYLTNFDQHKPVELNRGLYLLKGLLSKVKKGPGDTLLVNYDMVNSAFFNIRTSIDVLQLYSFAIFNGTIIQERDYQELYNYKMNREQRKNLRTLIAGLHLRTIVPVDMPREYRCIGVSRNNAHKQRFKLQQQELEQRPYLVPYTDGNGEISVYDYYKVHHKYQIRQEHMPVLVCGSEARPIYIPIECVVVMEKLHRLRGKIPDTLMPTVNSHTVHEPVYHFANIASTLGTLANKTLCATDGATSDPFLAHFGIEVENHFLEIEGRFLEGPKANIVAGLFYPSYAPLQKSMRKGDFDEREVYFSVVVVEDSVPCVDREVDKVLRELVEEFTRYNMRVNKEWQREKDYSRCYYTDDVGKLFAERKKVAVDIWKRLNKKPEEVVLVILLVVKQDDGAVTQFYNTAKNVCDRELGIITQFMRARTYLQLLNGGPKSRKLCGNLYLKVNAKLGGVNLRIDARDQLWSYITRKEEPTLFLGVDAGFSPRDYHLPVAAVVGNIDVDATRYAASVRIQPESYGPIQHLEEMALECILRFYKANGTYPAHIVVMRDGVSDSQFDLVLGGEYPQLMDACKKAPFEPTGGYKPTISIIVVQKRHSTRFYVPKSQQQVLPRGAINGNLPPGTVVDRFIINEHNELADPFKRINAKLFDDLRREPNQEFYLCSHEGQLGTSRPGRYHVLVNRWRELTADAIQGITYALCQLFARTTKPVSIPAPVYYAHLACCRARLHLAAQRDEADRSTPSTSQAGDAPPAPQMGPDQKMVEVAEAMKAKMYFT